jgi:hypothetical protein
VDYELVDFLMRKSGMPIKKKKKKKGSFNSKCQEKEVLLPGNTY